ncbi:MAG TPA: hypothetical protein VNZ61_22055 [Roseomonas sp.]|nr:hypothetical protein [Roseomonas sp.]
MLPLGRCLSRADAEALPVRRDLNSGADGIDKGTDPLHEVERLRFLGGTGSLLFNDPFWAS